MVIFGSGGAIHCDSAQLSARAVTIRARKPGRGQRRRGGGGSARSVGMRGRRSCGAGSGMSDEVTTRK